MRFSKTETYHWSLCRRPPCREQEQGSLRRGGAWWPTSRHRASSHRQFLAESHSSQQIWKIHSAADGGFYTYKEAWTKMTVRQTIITMSGCSFRKTFETWLMRTRRMVGRKVVRTLSTKGRRSVIVTWRPLPSFPLSSPITFGHMFTSTT